MSDERGRGVGGARPLPAKSPTPPAAASLALATIVIQRPSMIACTPEAVLHAAGVRLDDSPPRPVVDHRFARERLLAVAARHLQRDARARVASKIGAGAAR